MKLSDDIVREEKNNHKVKSVEKFPDLKIFLLKNFLVNVEFSVPISKCGILLGASGFSRVLSLKTCLVIVKLRHV